MTMIPDDVLELNLNKALSPELSEETQEIGFSDKLKAAFTVENSIGSMLVRDGGLPDQFKETDFDPWASLTEEEKLDDSFVGNILTVDNEEQLNAVRRQTAEERRAKASLTGIDGAFAAFVAGTLDPVSLIAPGATAWKTYKAGGSVLRGALATGAVAAGSAGATEIALQASQLERTGQESLVNIGGAAFLGGILGAGAAKLNQKAIQEVEEFLDVNSKIVKGADDLSAGAAQAANFGNVRIKGDLVEAAAKGLKWVDPVARAMTSSARATRELAAKLVSNPLELEGVPEGFKSAEALGQFKSGSYLGQAINEHRKVFDAMKKTPELGKVKLKEFNELVAKEVRNPGSANNAYAKQSADFINKTVYEPIALEMKQQGLLDEDIEVGTAARYLNRRWNKEKVISNRDAFNETTSKWLRSQDDLIKAGLDDADFEELANTIAHRIIGSPDGVLRYDMEFDLPQKKSKPTGKKAAEGLRSPFKARSFKIPDAMVEDFLENDIEQLMQIYTRHTVMDMEIQKMLSDKKTSLDEGITIEIEKIQDEYKDLSGKAKTPAERQKLTKSMNKDIIALKGMIDRMRGLYDLPKLDENNTVRRINRSLRNLSYLRFMGGVVPSSISDAARIVMAEGFVRAFGKGLAPLARNLNNLPAIKDELRYYGIAMDSITNGRVEAIADIGDYALGGNAAERGLDYLSNKFGSVTGMNQWNDTMKSAHALAMQSRLVDEAAAGNFSSFKRLGVSEVEAKEIYKQVKTHGSKVNGAQLFNAKAWSNPSAALAWGQAVRKESDRVIIVPGQEKPLMMSRDMGKTLLQFKSFMLSSTQRSLLAGLQGQDENFFGGMIAMVGLGMMSYAIKQKIAGREISDDPTTLVMEGIDRSGALGLIMEINNTAEKVTYNRVGLRPTLGISEPAARYASRNIKDTLMGPSYGSLLTNVLSISGAAFGEQDWAERDTAAVRRLIPYQNLFYMRNQFDKIESLIDESIRK